MRTRDPEVLFRDWVAHGGSPDWEAFAAGYRTGLEESRPYFEERLDEALRDRGLFFVQKNEILTSSARVIRSMEEAIRSLEAQLNNLRATIVKYHREV